MSGMRVILAARGRCLFHVKHLELSGVESLYWSWVNLFM